MDVRAGRATVTVAAAGCGGQPAGASRGNRGPAPTSSRWSRHTSQPESTIARDVERERAFTAEEARAYGLVDDLFVRRGHELT